MYSIFYYKLLNSKLINIIPLVLLLKDNIELEVNFIAPLVLLLLDLKFINISPSKSNSNNIIYKLSKLLILLHKYHVLKLIILLILLILVFKSLIVIDL